MESHVLRAMLKAGIESVNAQHKFSTMYRIVAGFIKANWCTCDDSYILMADVRDELNMW